MARKAANQAPKGNEQETSQEEVVEPTTETVEDTPKGNEEAPEEGKGGEGGEVETTYKVRRGDTLYAIAGFFGVDVEELAKVNGIENPNRIKAGDQIKVVSKVGEGDLHRVVRGETLTSIARDKDTDVDTLKDLNGLEDENKIVTGQVLRVR